MTSSNDRKPNLLFVMTDHQRADSIGVSRAGVEVCPHVNRLAAEGANFTRAYNTCPLCVPTRTALATGRYPTTTGIITNDWRGVTARDCKPIHQCLAEAGYDVAHVGIDHIKVKPPIRERVPFVKWIDNADFARHLEAHGLAEAHERCMGALKKEIVMTRDGAKSRESYSGPGTDVWPGPLEAFKDNFFADEAIAFLREPRERPFALFVYLWAPHPPLAVPEPYASMFDPAKIDLPANVGVPADGEPANRRDNMAELLAEGVTTDGWRKVWAAHLGLTRLADDASGRILDTLARSGHDENTVIVFTADHGDHLGQHDMYQKMEMYEQAIHIPLVVRTPGGKPGTFDAPVSHLDVMPTLLEILDIDAPVGLDGVSLVPSLHAGTPPVERSVFGMYAGNRAPGHHRRALISRKWKYVYDPEDVAELYDLENDPLETRNLAGETTYAETLRALHAECRAWHESHDDVIPF